MFTKIFIQASNFHVARQTKTTESDTRSSLVYGIELFLNKTTPQHQLKQAAKNQLKIEKRKINIKAIHPTCHKKTHEQTHNKSRQSKS